LTQGQPSRPPRREQNCEWPLADSTGAAGEGSVCRLSWGGRSAPARGRTRLACYSGWKSGNNHQRRRLARRAYLPKAHYDPRGLRLLPPGSGAAHFFEVVGEQRSRCSKVQLKRQPRRPRHRIFLAPRLKRDAHHPVRTRHSGWNLAAARSILRCPQCWASGVSETRCRRPPSAKASNETTPSLPNAIRCFASAVRATLGEIAPTRLGR